MLQKVLLVDDNVLVRMDAAMLLQEAGYHVIEAGNAEVALSILWRDPKAIHILVTDFHMPGKMNGLSLATAVDVLWPHIRIVVVSARAGLTDDDIPDHGRFVAKPWVPAEIVDAVRTAGLP